MSTPKFCKDCKHATGEDAEMKCMAPQNFVSTTNDAKYLVTGQAQPTVRAARGNSCMALRTERAPGVITCGPTGNWYEAK